MQKFYYDIFLSYSHENECEAKKLYQVLKLNGLRVWFDLIEFEGRENPKNYKEEIYIALKYCPIFICIISKNYVNTKYCIEEYRHAFRATKSIIALMTEKGHLIQYGYIGFLLSLAKLCPIYADVDDFLDNYTGEMYLKFLTMIRENYAKNGLILSDKFGFNRKTQRYLRDVYDDLMEKKLSKALVEYRSEKN